MRAAAASSVIASAAQSRQGWGLTAALDKDGLLNLAEGAAEQGARIVSDYGRSLFGWRLPGQSQNETSTAGVEQVDEEAGFREAKGSGDYVTKVDIESEQAIRDFLEQRTPEIPVLGEEEGGDTGERYWAVDPVDGTTNFTLGVPLVGVSVGLIDGGEPVVGVVRVPALGLSFRAAAGRGAWLGTTRLQVSTRPRDKAVLGTGFPTRDRSLMSRYLPVFERLLREVEDMRRMAVASLDLAWVAAGVFDGYFHLNLQLWDIAAGVLLIQEAGGIVTDWEGGTDYLSSGNLLAGSPETHPTLLDAAATSPNAR